MKCKEHDVAQSVCMNWCHVGIDRSSGKDWAKTINVYELNDIEWWMGSDPDEILKVAMERYGSREDATGEPDGMPRPLTDSELDRLEFKDDLDGSVRTFREELVRQLKAGEKGPAFFASSEC